MRYIKCEPFKGIKGQPVKVAEDKDATTGDIVRFVLEQYQPTQAFNLPVAKIRLLNRAIDILEKPPFQSGYYALEDQDFEVVKSVAGAVAPLLAGPIVRLAPAIVDILENALDKEPEKEAAHADA